MTQNTLPVPADAPADVVEYKPAQFEHVKLTESGPKNFKHAFLTDVSGKGEEFEGIDFSYCTFTRGYFHKAKFRECKFTGARFTDCNFRGASFTDCDFRYADFTGTRIETSEILKSLPDEPNIRRELLQILRKNALSLGDVGSSRQFVIAEIAAKRDHLRRAWRRDEKYYRNKYSGFWKHLGVGLKRVGFWADSFFWGHGERLWKIAISASALLVLAATVSTMLWAGSQIDPTISSVAAEFIRYLTYYFALFLDVPYPRPLGQWFWMDAGVILARYIAFGVLVAGLFRWLSHR